MSEFRSATSRSSTAFAGPAGATVLVFQTRRRTRARATDPATNVTDEDELTTGKIARAHLNEFSDYYMRLAQMEAEAERYWAGRDAGDRQ